MLSAQGKRCESAGSTRTADRTAGDQLVATGAGLVVARPAEQLPKPYDGAEAGPWLQQLNAILKRLCRERYPQNHSHTLSSRAWLAFLDSRCPAAGLTRWMILVEGAYRPHCSLDDKAIAGLNQAVAIWIRKHV